MPTAKPRVLVTLEPSRYALLQELAGQNGLRVSQLIGALVEQAAGLLAWEARGHLPRRQPSLFPDAVMDVLREVYPQKDDREALARLGDAMDLLKSSGLRIVSDHLAELSRAGGAGSGEHAAQAQPGAESPPSQSVPKRSRKRSAKAAPPYSNTGVTIAHSSSAGGNQKRRKPR